MAHDEKDLQRAVGRIEGQLGEITNKLNAMIVNHIQHEDDDRRDFGDLRSLISNNIAQQDKKISAVKEDQDRAKGAGWVILGLLGALATFVGGAVIAATGGHIRFS
jgi:hypothetical protein